MNSFNNLPALLPANASQLITALTELLTYPDNTQLLHDIWQPNKCPSALLPWLAWSLSVDNWNDAWTEHTKRQVLNDAFEVHRYKATPYALKKALDSLNIRTDIQEWWHTADAQRGTVIVNALVNENLDAQEEGLLTKKMLTQIKRIVETVKRASIHVEVQLGIALEEQIGMGLNAPAGIGLCANEGQFNGVKPDLGYAKLNAFFTTKSGIGALEHSTHCHGITPEAAKIELSTQLVGKTGLAINNNLTVAIGIRPEQSILDHSIFAVFNHVQLNSFNLQGAI